MNVEAVVVGAVLIVLVAASEAEKTSAAGG